MAEVEVEVEVDAGEGLMERREEEKGGSMSIRELSGD